MRLFKKDGFLLNYNSLFNDPIRALYIFNTKNRGFVHPALIFWMTGVQNGKFDPLPAIFLFSLYVMAVQT